MEIVGGVMQMMEEKRRLCLQIMGSWATRLKQDVSPFGLLPLVDLLFCGPDSDPSQMLLGFE
ncbi:hypothetical protein A2U01_0069896 [Trifolium medium]|uniref:Uncharacterized protein n=1 Tax=Trifolium medium TaxID=97028 RepID=A0A392SIE5_9FABA|nr:hypothetical protein [Trifolium medium]